MKIASQIRTLHPRHRKMKTAYAVLFFYGSTVERLIKLRKRHGKKCKDLTDQYIDCCDALRSTTERFRLTPLKNVSFSEALILTQQELDNFVQDLPRQKQSARKVRVESNVVSFDEHQKKKTATSTIPPILKEVVFSQENTVKAPMKVPSTSNIIVGKLLQYGVGKRRKPKPKQNLKPGESEYFEHFYIDIQSVDEPTPERIHGVDLERAIAQAGVKVGDTIRVIPGKYVWVEIPGQIDSVRKRLFSIHKI
ncbi:MAG: hypothetical protein OEY38_17780 [Gammaproteobacteria bacterium]|nr:hypothetical protein [Gammaproteobacteria bacterium]